MFPLHVACSPVISEATAGHGMGDTMPRHIYQYNIYEKRATPVGSASVDPNGALLSCCTSIRECPATEAPLFPPRNGYIY